MDLSVAKSYRSRCAFRSGCGGRAFDLSLRGQNVLGVRDNFCVDLFGDGYASLISHAIEIETVIFLLEQTEAPFSVYNVRLWLALTLTIILKNQAVCSVDFWKKKQAERVPALQVHLVQVARSCRTGTDYDLLGLVQMLNMRLDDVGKSFFRPVCRLKLCRHFRTSGAVRVLVGTEQSASSSFEQLGVDGRGCFLSGWWRCLKQNGVKSMKKYCFSGIQ